MPKVSVIVPVYNTEKYLKKCLNSLVNQTLDDIEIVVVDDGSTDSSPSIIDEFAREYPYKLVVVHKKNGGQATARNMALKICTGAYIGFLDSDDYVNDNMFEKLYIKAIENDADYVGCGYRDELDDNGQVKVLSDFVGNKPCKNNREMYLNGAKVSPFINFYKRELILDNDIYFTEGVIYEDTAFWAKIVPFIKNPVYIQEALAVRVRHDNSTMTITKPEKVRNIFPVMDDLICFYKEKQMFESYCAEIEYFCTRVLLCSSMRRIKSTNAPKEQKKLIDETFTFIKKNFPCYKKNKYLRLNVVDLYIRFSNPVFSRLLMKI